MQKFCWYMPFCRIRNSILVSKTEVKFFQEVCKMTSYKGLKYLNVLQVKIILKNNNIGHRHPQRIIGVDSRTKL